jgi:hypothetical protein
MGLTQHFVRWTGHFISAGFLKLHLSPDQLGLIFGFVGGLTMAADLMGSERFEKLETFAEHIFLGRMIAAGYLKYTVGRVIEAILALWKVIVLMLVLVAANWGCLFLLPFVAGHKLMYYPLVAVRWMVDIVLAIIFGPVYIAAAAMIFGLALLGGLIIAQWTLTSPWLLAGYLKEKYGFKAAVPLVGVLLVTLGFLLQLVASFRR